MKLSFHRIRFTGERHLNLVGLLSFYQLYTRGCTILCTIIASHRVRIPVPSPIQKNPPLLDLMMQLSTVPVILYMAL